VGIGPDRSRQARFPCQEPDARLVGPWGIREGRPERGRRLLASCSVPDPSPRPIFITNLFVLGLRMPSGLGPVSYPCRIQKDW